MASVSEGFVSVPPAQRVGRSIGVLPGMPWESGYMAPDGYPNPWIEIPIRTHLPGRGSAGSTPDSRNSINVLSADVIVAFPGGAGTASEVDLALRFGRPMVLYSGAHEMPTPLARAPRVDALDALLAWLDDAIERVIEPHS